MKRRRDRRDSAPEINLTPMIDMVFILLIFFLVASSFVKEAGIEVNRPVAQTAQTQGRGTIRIALSETGEIWMERRGDRYSGRPGQCRAHARREP